MSGVPLRTGACRASILVEGRNLNSNAIGRLLRPILLCCCVAAAPAISAGQSPEPIPALTELPSAPEPQLAQATNSSGSQNQNQQKPEPQSEQQPANAPSLGDLGFTPEQTKPNAQLQAMLDKRTHMLKIHQRLGIITTIPMLAALITGPMRMQEVAMEKQLSNPRRQTWTFTRRWAEQQQRCTSPRPTLPSLRPRCRECSVAVPFGCIGRSHLSTDLA
jgi:hypothetical protein